MVLCIDIGTELAPAVSLAYEPSEANVMMRPPRDRKDSIVNWAVLRYVFLQGGLVITAVPFLGFVLCLEYYGFNPNTLWFTAANYWVPGSASLQGWDDTHQVEALAASASVYWWLLVGTQVGHIFLCRTREVSIFNHGFTTNVVLLYGVIIEVCLILLIIFPPSSHLIFGSSTFPPSFWPLVFVSWAALFILHESVKYVRRNFPHSLIGKYLLF